MSSPLASHTCTSNHYSTLITHYDYIITGSGCAGLSLLYRMILHPFFADKQILVIDRNAKTSNDRTWCYWEKDPGLFEPVVYHKWQQIDFYSKFFSGRFDIGPYDYKMIRGIDFYNYILKEAKQQANVHFLYGTVQALHGDLNTATVTVDGQRFTSEYIFNSIVFNYSNKVSPLMKKGSNYYLLQHFKGWLIETAVNIFDDRIATFMDFRVTQDQGTAFAYVLPVTANKGIVEYTLFTENILEQNKYDNVLAHYIKNFLGIRDYRILEEEYGIIPMTNLPFSSENERIIHTGTAGGQTKPSSGYTFRFIQKHSDAIIGALVKGQAPNIQRDFYQKRFKVYDNTLLNVLYNKKLNGDEIFTALFKKNPVQRIFRFLDNESNLVEELKLVNTVPTSVFLPAAMRELFR